MTKSKGKAYWAKHVEGWRGSGLTQARYCARYGLSVTSLKYWSWQLRRGLECCLSRYFIADISRYFPVFEWRSSGMDHRVD